LHDAPTLDAPDEDEVSMVIQWGRQMPDPDAGGGVILQAIVDGKTVPVYLSAEAKDDYGISACKLKAENKIRSASVVPSRVDITTADFR
jgi:uncharacterized protein (DUF39 family)